MRNLCATPLSAFVLGLVGPCQATPIDPAAPLMQGAQGAGLWLADAFPGTLQHLEDDLVVGGARPLDEPRRLVSGPVLFALVAGGRRVEVWEEGAQRAARSRALPRPARAATLFQDELVVLVGRGATAQLFFLDARLELREEAALSSAIALAGGPTGLFVATEGGEILACRGRPLGVTHAARARSGVEGLALSADGAELWSRSGAHVTAWSPTLEPGWERGFDAPIARLVPAAVGRAGRSDGVWCVLASGRGCVRLDHEGALVAEVPELPCLRIADALGRPGGGLLIACTGALLEIDGRGTLTRTQGGFAELVALAVR